MSTIQGSALPPAFSIASATVKTVPGSLGWGSAVLAATTTFAPSRAHLTAIASPIPLEAPEMKMVRPARNPVLIILLLSAKKLHYKLIWQMKHVSYIVYIVIEYTFLRDQDPNEPPPTRSLASMYHQL